MKKLTTYIPVASFLGLMVYSFHSIMSADYEPCSCVVQFSNDYLMNEILFTLSGVYMLSITTRLKPLYYNKISSIGLISMSLLNIIAIVSPFDFSIYNSLVTQILFTATIVAVVYFVIKKL